jgi:Protein of unknown function (DUF1499)
MKARPVIAAATALILVGGVVAYDLDATWALVAGPPDLGPVDFASVKPPASPNRYLACPQDLCPAGAADMTSPTFDMSAADLQRTARKAWAGEPNLTLVSGDEENHEDRYVQRSKIMRFPDTVAARFIDQADGKSSLALYSRSQIGRSDFGVNKARVLHWLDLVKAQAGSN